MPERALRLSVLNQSLFCTERNSTAAHPSLFHATIAVRPCGEPRIPLVPGLYALFAQIGHPTLCLRAFLASTETKRMATTPDRQPKRA